MANTLIDEKKLHDLLSPSTIGGILESAVFSGNNPHMRLTWHLAPLLIQAQRWLKGLRGLNNSRARENSLWWSFIFRWSLCIRPWLMSFREGAYCFSPLSAYRFISDPVRVLWIRLKPCGTMRSIPRLCSATLFVGQPGGTTRSSRWG